MKNKIYSLLIILILSFLFLTKLNSEEIFIFNISELQVTDDGNFIEDLTVVRHIQRMKSQLKQKILSIIKLLIF